MLLLLTAQGSLPGWKTVSGWICGRGSKQVLVLHKCRSMFKNAYTTSVLKESRLDTFSAVHTEPWTAADFWSGMTRYINRSNSPFQILFFFLHGAKKKENRPYYSWQLLKWWLARAQIWYEEWLIKHKIEFVEFIVFYFARSCAAPLCLWAWNWTWTFPPSYSYKKLSGGTQSQKTLSTSQVQSLLVLVNSMMVGGA